jgi:hypothetical protein
MFGAARFLYNMDTTGQDTNTNEAKAKEKKRTE